MDDEVRLKTAKFPNTELSLGRVTVFLGANGTGKSKLMKEFKDKGETYFTGRDVIYVEGGRTISIPNTVEVDRNNFNNHKTVAQSTTTHKNKRKNTLAERVKDALILLDRQGEEMGIRHSDAVTEWQKNGKEGDCPIRLRPPLESLFDQFHSIFPTIKLSFQPESKNLLCKKNDGPGYGPNDLSDGEKQVLSILADIAYLGNNNSLIIVDEPELNLNAGLAYRLWEIIEAELEGAIFIYATHNIGFAKRPSVDGLYVLGREENYIAEIGDIREIDPEELPSLLGTIPAILSYSSVLVIEGKDDSFDFPFYEWILEGTEAGIVSVEGSNDVKAVTARAGVWDKIATGIKLRGVIDRDYKPEADIGAVTDGVCIALQYHEAESYLCHPDLVSMLSSKLGVSELSIDDVKEIIFKEFEKSILSIATQRVVAQTNIRLCVSVENQVLAKITDKAKLEKVLCTKAEEEMKKASVIGPDKTRALFAKEIRLCEEASKNKDIEKILELMPSKQLLTVLASKIGLKNKMDFLKATKKQIKVDEMPHLKGLSEQLKGLFVPPMVTVQEKRSEGLEMVNGVVVVSGMSAEPKVI